MKELKKFRKVCDESLSLENIDFEMSSVDKVSELEVYVDMVLEALGHEEALVTDESQLYDFIDVFDESEEIERVLGDLRENLGVEIYDDCEKIVDIAQRLKDKGNE